MTRALQVREMFYHAFDGYMDHAFPQDELRPMSCGGEDTIGSYALTLVTVPIFIFISRFHFLFFVHICDGFLRFMIPD